MNTITTWINTIISLIGIYITVPNLDLFWDYRWQILAGLEFFIVLWLFYNLARNKVLILGWTTWRVNNKPVYTKFVNKESALISKRIAQLRAGYLKLYGDEVQRVQKELFDFLRPREERENTVLASDITLNPEVLITRTGYHERNKKFISSGGTIKRLFLVPDERLFTKTFARDFITVLDINSSLSIETGLLPFSLLGKEDIADYIVFGDAAVLIEDVQADAHYLMGRSDLRFTSSDVQAHIVRFNTLWNTLPFRAAGIVEMYKRYVGKANLMSASTLAAAKVSFYNDLRTGRTVTGNQ